MPIVLVVALILISACSQQQEQKQGLIKKIYTSEDALTNKTGPDKASGQLPRQQVIEVDGKVFPVYENNATVRIGETQFLPEIIYVKPGTNVTWVNEFPRVHLISDYNGVFRSEKLAFGDSYSRVFAAPGEFTYRCLMFNWKGKIVVVE